MITQPGWRKDVVLRKFVIEAHPIIQTYLQILRIPELIASYIQQDHRIKLPIEQTLGVLIHNILTTPKPMYEIATWLAPLDRKFLFIAIAISDARCSFTTLWSRFLELLPSGYGASGVAEFFRHLDLG